VNKMLIIIAESHTGPYRFMLHLGNAGLKHGRYTAEEIVNRREIAALLRTMKALARTTGRGNKFTGRGEPFHRRGWPLRDHRVLQWITQNKISVRFEARGPLL
jgi:hypothetical protein